MSSANVNILLVASSYKSLMYDNAQGTPLKTDFKLKRLRLPDTLPNASFDRCSFLDRFHCFFISICSNILLPSCFSLPLDSSLHVQNSVLTWKNVLRPHHACLIGPRLDRENNRGSSLSSHHLNVPYDRKSSMHE